VISTISCLVVAGISLSAWAWRGPLSSEREQKAGAGTVAERTANSAPAATPTPATRAPAPTKSAPAGLGGPTKPAASTPAGAATTASGSPAASATPAPPVAQPEPLPTAAPATAADIPPPARPTTTLPIEVVRSPTLYETGRIGKAAVNEPGVPANRGGERAAPPEQLVQAKQPERREAPTPAAYTGVVDQAVLDRELAPRFRLLGDCKADLAHRKRVAVSSITGSRLLLRWTILPSGRVADTQIVATSPADPRLLDCVKERMSGWAFRPAKGGTVRVERKFAF